jgi:hypothetical protein
LFMFTKKKVDGGAVLSVVLVSVMYLFQYIQNRIFYNMCKSI